MSTLEPDNVGGKYSLVKLNLQFYTSIYIVQFSLTSVQSLNWLGHWVDMRDNSAESNFYILFPNPMFPTPKVYIFIFVFYF